MITGQKIICEIRTNAKEQRLLKDAAAGNEIIFAREAVPPYRLVRPLDAELMADADVYIGRFNPDALKAAGNLKWVQTWSSGVDAYLRPGILPEGVMLSSATGAYGTAVAEQVFAMMLAIMKRLPAYRDNQFGGKWEKLGACKYPDGSDILIIGTGSLGSTFATYCKAFGAHTTGVRRDKSKPAAGIDEMHGMDELETLIPKADVIVSLIPHSEEMRGYFNYERFKSMKQDAIFMNAGRGTIVDCMALYRVLSEGWLWGAGLDTLDPEPFPAEHPLWKEPRALITPHIAGDDIGEPTLRKVAAIALENLKRYVSGKELINRKL